LPLTLIGVVIAAEAEASGAIVSGPGQPTRANVVGQAVAPKPTLVEDHGDHVVLIVAGRRETLSFRRAADQPAAEQTDRGVDALRTLVTVGADTAEDDALDEGP
jgi:type II secretory pathway component PulC